MEQNDVGRNFNKIQAEDMWKEFGCPRYVTFPCPDTGKIPKEMFNFCKDAKLDANSILEKLCGLISDPLTSCNVLRICRLLYDYLYAVGNIGYKVKDLPLVVQVLMFLARHVEQVKEYELHLDRMLELCEIPPLLEKSSDGFVNIDVVAEYFTMLGNLLTILQKKQHVQKVHNVIDSLLQRTKRRNPSAIKYKHCCKAMENSNLPIIVADLLRTSLPDNYQKNLELVFFLSSISCICSHRMIEANILNTIFTRMDLPYATQLRCMRPPDSLLTGNEYSDETMLLILDTLWSLLKCIILTNDVPVNLQKNLKSPHCALWGLCYAFKRQVFYGQNRSFNVKIRNQIAMIILILSIAFPSWNLVGSGIAETIIKYLVGIECGTVRVFSDIVKFGRTNEDLYFEKILLLIVAHIAEIDACIYEKLMLCILELVNPEKSEKTKMTWSPSQFWNLWTYAINVLSILTPKMPKQFMEYKGSIRLCMLLDWCLATNVDVKIIMSCTKTICEIIQCNNRYLLECLREHGLINHILKLEKITMNNQRILTLALMSIEKLMRRQMYYQEIYGEHSVTFIMELLFRCFYQKNEEFQIDQRLLLAAGSYIWECIVWCPKNLERFIQYGAVYIILDIIETVPYYSQCLFLAVLTDICENYFCGPFLCTWRGNDRKTGLMSLLAKIWREEEIRIKAMRNADGTVKDEELPQMGYKQWLDTYCSKISRDISPALTDMIGSIRSKIYCIRKIIERDNERYQLAKEHYKILHDNIPLEDKITLSTIDLYFILKLGQVWVEVSRYFEQVGINLLGIDSQAVFLMTQRYYLWGTITKERQMKIIEAVKKEEDVEEKDEYARIRDSKLVLALDAFNELDYIYRTTDRSYMLRKKKEQVQQVNKALRFPPKSDNVHCHRTFQDKVMVTPVFNQHQTIISGLRPDTNLSQMKLRLPLISPCDSFIYDKTYRSEISSPSLSNVCLARIEKFPESK